MSRSLPYRAAAAALILAATTTLWGTGSVSAAPDAASGVSVVQARGIRERAEAKLAKLRAEKVDLDLVRENAAADADAVTEDLAAARSAMRNRAVAAYVGDSSDRALAAFFDSGNAMDSADRRVLLMSQYGDAADDADRFRRLKADTDPRLVEMAMAVEDLDARLAEAEDAVIQARAVEQDAERAEDRARRAAEAAAAATTTAPATRSSASATPPTSPPTAAVAAPTSPSTSPAPAPTAAPAPLPDPPAGGPTEAQWAALRKCESGGNYQIVSSNGKYRGAYQFDYQTWESMGGRGDPAAASPAEQDLRAKILYSQRGARPWPSCGIHLR